MNWCFDSELISQLGHINNAKSLPPNQMLCITAYDGNQCESRIFLIFLQFYPISLRIIRNIFWFEAISVFTLYFTWQIQIPELHLFCEKQSSIRFSENWLLTSIKLFISLFLSLEIRPAEHQNIFIKKVWGLDPCEWAFPTFLMETEFGYSMLNSLEQTCRSPVADPVDALS